MRSMDIGDFLQSHLRTDSWGKPRNKCGDYISKLGKFWEHLQNDVLDRVKQLSDKQTRVSPSSTASILDEGEHYNAFSDKFGI